MAYPRILALVCFATVAWLFAACAAGGSDQPSQFPTPTPTPPFGLPPLELPADEEPHDFQTEWWYFNMHLESPDGERFALHDVVFQVRERDSGRTLYVRQTGIADAQHRLHQQAERLRAEAERLPAPKPGGFFFEMGDWSMSGSDGERYKLRASAGEYSYDLALTNTTPPLLHGQEGLVDFDYAGVSYYFTRPRLEVSGTLTLPTGRELEVNGLGWMDKQWGDFQPVIVGWDWASVQLDDGTDVTLSRLFDEERTELHYYATVRLSGEEQEEVGADDGLEFTALDEVWESPTGIAYRTHWNVRIPSHDLEFALVPLVDGVEFASQVLGVTYWEAGVDAVSPDGRRIGQGFIELNWPRGTDNP